MPDDRFCRVTIETLDGTTSRIELDHDGELTDSQLIGCAVASALLGAINSHAMLLRVLAVIAHDLADTVEVNSDAIGIAEKLRKAGDASCYGDGSDVQPKSAHA